MSLLTMDKKGINTACAVDVNRNGRICKNNLHVVLLYMRRYDIIKRNESRDRACSAMSEDSAKL